jgi:hypothetical protein
MPEPVIPIIDISIDDVKRVSNELVDSLTKKKEIKRSINSLITIVLY